MSPQNARFLGGQSWQVSSQTTSPATLLLRDRNHHPTPTTTTATRDAHQPPPTLLNRRTDTPPAYTHTQTPQRRSSSPPHVSTLLTFPGPAEIAFVGTPGESPPRNPLRHSRPLYHSIPLPSQLDGHSDYPGSRVIRLHPYLDIAETWSTIPVNVSLPPHFIVPPPDDLQGLFRHATAPSLPSLTVWSPLLPWPIIVHSSSIAPGIVTIADVFGTICGVLQWPLYPDEPSALGVQFDEPSIGNGRGCRRHSGRVKKRIDLLRGRHRFLGLSKDDSEEDGFILHLA